MLEGLVDDAELIESKFPVYFFSVPDSYHPNYQFGLGERVDDAVHAYSITPKGRSEVPLQLFSLAGIMGQLALNRFTDMLGSLATQAFKVVLSPLFPEW